MDLTADPGPWLLRALLATNAARVSIVVPDTHPDLSSWSALLSLIGPKYRLSVRRGYPEPGYALVEAVAVAAAGVARLVLERAHGKVGNAWREGLIRSTGTAALTKNEARAVIASTVRRPELLDASPMSLPRHQLVELLRDIARGRLRAVALSGHHRPHRSVDRLARRRGADEAGCPTTCASAPDECAAGVQGAGCETDTGAVTQEASAASGHAS